MVSKKKVVEEPKKVLSKEEKVALIKAKIKNTAEMPVLREAINDILELI
jgi:hypothetical protein